MKLSRWHERFKWVTKEALAQPISKEREKQLLEEKNLLSVPDIRDKYPKGGKGGTKRGRGYKDIIKEVEVEDLFQTDDPRLRSWIAVEADKIGIIDGKEYVIVRHKKPTKTKDGHIVVVGPLVRNEDGKFDASQSTVTPSVLPYSEYIDKIQVPPEAIQKNLDAINSEIKTHNDFLDKMDKRIAEGKGSTVTVLPLQITRAEEAIKNRIRVLDEQRKSIEDATTKRQEQAEAGMEAIEGTYENLKGDGSDISPQDYAILLLERKFHSVESLESLKNELANEQMPFEPQINELLRKFIMSVVDWQIQERQKEIQKQEDAAGTREERKMDESELPQMKELLFQRIAPVESLKGTVKKSQEYYSPMAMLSAKDFTSQSIDRDHSELMAVLNSLEQAKQTIVDLPSKTNEYITGEGAYRLQEIEAFVKNTDVFLRRYAEPVLVESEGGLQLSPKLLGNQGQLGNSLVAIVLKQIRASVQSELDRIKGGKAPEGVEGVEGAEEVEEVVAPEKTPTKEAVPGKRVPAEASGQKGQTKIEKMSETFWKSFERRGRLR